MFTFRRAAREITIFHHPSSPPSQKALNLLRSATSGPFPPEKTSAPPLDFNLEVVESPPTSDQLRTILSYVAPQKNAASVFLSSHPSGSSPLSPDAPQSVSAIHDAGSKNPNALKWPIVVDWAAGQATVGDVEGVKSLLETLRKRRDGELPNEDDVDKPKGWFA